MLQYNYGKKHFNRKERIQIEILQQEEYSPDWLVSVLAVRKTLFRRELPITHRTNKYKAQAAIVLTRGK